MNVKVLLDGRSRSYRSKSCRIIQLDPPKQYAVQPEAITISSDEEINATQVKGSYVHGLPLPSCVAAWQHDHRSRLGDQNYILVWRGKVFTLSGRGSMDSEVLEGADTQPVSLLGALHGG